MKYPLPRGYHFQIRRNGRIDDNCYLVDARLVAKNCAIVDSVKDYHASFERPTCRLSAGDVLFHMLRNIDGQCRKVLSPEDFELLEDRAMEMAGLERVPNDTPNT